MNDDLKLLTASDLAALWGVSERKVYLLIQRGEIRSVRLGRNVRVRRSDALQYINAQAGHLSD